MPQLVSNLPAFRDALFAQWQTLLADQPEVLVSFGMTDPSYPDDVCVVADGRSSQEPATLGTNRSREESIDVDVMVSSFVSGGPEAEKLSFDRAFALLGLLENYARFTDTTFGGVVRHSAVTDISYVGTPGGATGPGRYTDISATFHAQARISS